MPRRVTTTIASLATAALAGVALTSAPATAAPTATTGVPGVPYSCQASLRAYSSTGSLAWYEYSKGTAKSLRVGKNSLGWQPTAAQQLGAGGDPTSFFSTEVATSKGGKLMQIRQNGKLSNGAWSVTQSATTLRSSGWTGTRALVASYGSYLYRLHGSTLTRYKQGASADGKLTLSAGTRVGTNWGGVRSMVYERTGVVSGRTIDVFLANDTSGRLVEYRIPRTEPAKWTRTVLRSTGFKSVRALTTSPCGSSGRAIGAITDTDTMYVWYDPKVSDLKGGDIRGGWTGKRGFSRAAFGQ